jgi:hypothetical protein
LGTNFSMLYIQPRSGGVFVARNALRAVHHPMPSIRDHECVIAARASA